MSNKKVPWVVLIGLDGSGKTTVLNQLETLCVPPMFAGVKVIHRRLGVVLPKKTGDLEPGKQVNHYAHPPHNPVKSTIKLGFIVFDWLAGYWGWVTKQQSKGFLVIFDRYYLLDLLVDPRRHRYNGPVWLTRSLRQNLPKPDLVIFLDAPIEILLNRKQEVSAEDAQRQRTAYLNLIPTLSNSHIVDASQPLEKVVADVHRLILDYTATLQQT